MMKVFLSDTARKIILAEAAKTYPDECCGALLGLDRENGERSVELAVPIDNEMEANEKYHRFQITADDIMKVERIARQRGVDVLGFYHSHPDHPALPSEYDKDHALPYYTYLIISVAKGQPRELLAWRLKADRSTFVSDEIIYK